MADKSNDNKPEEVEEVAPVVEPETVLEVSTAAPEANVVIAPSVHGNVKDEDVAARAAEAEAAIRIADPMAVVVREADPRIGGNSFDYGKPEKK